MKAIIAYKNMPAGDFVSHIGLGVSALNTAKVLRKHGLEVDVWSTLDAIDIAYKIEVASEAGHRPTHVVISAPWIPTLDLQKLVFSHSDIQFVVTCHSNVGFLQADPQGLRLFRDVLNLERGSLNMLAAGNSKRFCRWIEDAYGSSCLFLPNLYYLDKTSATNRPLFNGGTLRVGAFGAIRPLKNLLTAGAAVLEIANNLHTDTEMHISAGRVEGGVSVLRSLDEMFRGVPGVRLVYDEWQQWPQFRRLVRSMHVMIQISYTESFNIVTADGVAEGVPSVVSSAIDWAPQEWKSDVDDALQVAKRGRSLIGDRDAGSDGFEALQEFNRVGIQEWTSFLTGSFIPARKGGD